MTNVQLVVIDPQYDFMDYPDSALPVPGADADMTRLAAMVDRIAPRLDDVHVTLDSHRYLDVGHPSMWLGTDGKTHPAPFTAISSDDIRNGIWTPRFAHAKHPELNGLTVREYMIRYASQLEEQGSYQLMVWNFHCLIGTPGHAVHKGLMDALNRWSEVNFAAIDFVTKGTNPWTEHYGALKAEVPMASDPSTTIASSARLLEILAKSDMVAFAGEALSHCVRETVRQVADNVDPRLLSKFYLLRDCMSSIPAVPGGPDFPAISQNWLDEMVGRGMKLTTSTEFLA